LAPCPYGQINQGGQCVAAPASFDRDYLGEPDIMYQPLSPGDPAVTLVCSVPLSDHIQSWKNVTYQINWYSEGKHLKTDDSICDRLAPGETEHVGPCPGEQLLSRLLGTEYTLNRWISCNVTARYTTSTANPWCIPKTVRKPFFAGLKVKPTILKITECSNEEKTFQITPTIPIGESPWTPGGYLNISFSLPRGIQLVNTEDCKVEMKNRETVTIRVIARCSTIRGTNNKVIIPKIVDYHSLFWNPAQVDLPSIWVSVESNANNIHSCQAYTDPHYYSLPRPVSGRWGSKNYFTFMGHGDFVLYNNTERNFEVHTRQWACGRARVTCNCGVVLRDHNDVIEFNCCNELLFYDQATPMRFKVRSKKRLAPGISITQTIRGFNSEYQVRFKCHCLRKRFRGWNGGSTGFDVPCCRR